MHLDSTMCEYVLNELVIKRGLVCLPIHDSFIVQEHALTILVKAMKDGRDAFSRVSEVSEIPSLIKGLPSLKVNTQPLEAAAAEKLLAVINQPDTDMRVKHVADVLDERLWEGVNCGDIARELQRVCRHRGIDTTSLPDTIVVETYERLRDNWSKHYRPGMPPVDFGQAISNAAYLWSEVQECMTPSMRPLPTSSPVVAERRFGGMR